MNDTKFESYIGIDIAKDKFDVAVNGDAKVQTFFNTESGRSEFIVAFEPTESTLFVVEASGGFEQALITDLLLAQAAVAKVNPKRVRDFAKAIGQFAKTDAIDAQLIAKFAATLQPDVLPLKDVDQIHLSALLTRRRQLVGMLAAEKNRLTTIIKSMRPDLEDHIVWLEQRIKSKDEETDAFIDTNTDWKEKRKRLKTVPGVGPVTSLVLLAELPELGKLTAKQVASLAGLAPFNRDSGTLNGRRVIWGGRAAVRRALYMAAVSAIRCNAPIREFFHRLRNEYGKPFKLAITACMRKLLVFMNAMLRDQIDWNGHKQTSIA